MENKNIVVDYLTTRLEELKQLSAEIREEHKGKPYSTLSMHLGDLSSRISFIEDEIEELQSKP